MRLIQHNAINENQIERITLAPETKESLTLYDLIFSSMALKLTQKHNYLCAGILLNNVAFLLLH